MDKSNIFRNYRGDIHDRWQILIIVMVSAFILISIVVVVNVAYIEGVEKTVTGTVQLHLLKYNKVLDMKYTECELRTYSGDTHHVIFLGHIELDLHQAYRMKIRYVNYWGHILIANKLMELVQVEGV